MGVIKIFVVFALLVGLSGCNAGKEERKESNKQALNQKQIACLKKITRKQIEQAGKFSELSLQAIQENKSDIELQIMKRRANESLCVLQLECYGPQEPMVKGAIFSSCLKEAENSNNG